MEPLQDLAWLVWNFIFTAFPFQMSQWRAEFTFYTSRIQLHFSLWEKKESFHLFPSPLISYHVFHFRFAIVSSLGQSLFFTFSDYKSAWSLFDHFILGDIYYWVKICLISFVTQRSQISHEMTLLNSNHSACPHPVRQTYAKASFWALQICPHTGRYFPPLCFHW